MKRTIFIIAALALVLSGCAKGVTIGKDGGTGCGESGNEACKSAIPTTASPTVSPKTTTKKSTPPPTTSVPARPGSNYTIMIRNNGNGYEPPQLVVRVGDTIVFKNLDPDTATGHTFTGRQHEWDSGTVKYKGTWSYKVDLKPGDYLWFDQNVPYLTGGPLRVLPAA